MRDIVSSLSLRFTRELAKITHAKIGELTKSNSLPDLQHGVKVEGQTVVCAESISQQLAAQVKMPDVGARIPAANPAPAILIQRSLIRPESRIFYVQLAARSEDLPIAGIAGRQDTVEHIDPPGHAFDQVFG